MSTIPQAGGPGEAQNFDPYRHPYPDYPFQRLRFALSVAMLYPRRVGRHYEAECPLCERRTLDLIRLPDRRPALRPRCRCDIDDIWDAIIDGARYNGVDAEKGLANWDWELLPRPVRARRRKRVLLRRAA